MRMFFDQSNIDPSMGCGDDTRDFAESVVYAYSTDELDERIPAWFNHNNNHCWVHDELCTELGEILNDEQFDAYWNHIVANKDVYRLVLAYLIARKGYVWESFLDYYADREEANHESFH